MKWTPIIASALFLLIAVSCSTTKTTSSAASAEEGQNMGNMSLLDRLRQQAGLNIRGSDSSAEIYLRGVSSVNNPKQVLFIIDGAQVGDFSRAASTLNPLEIGSIRVLKNPQDLAQYGFMGAGGVIIITTKKIN
jgi:TonB-dependent SusC/RagA subfamily outer membrane receptor